MSAQELREWFYYFKRNPFGDDIHAFYVKQLTYLVNRSLGGNITMDDLDIFGGEDVDEDEPINFELMMPAEGREFLRKVQEQEGLNVDRSEP